MLSRLFGQRNNDEQARSLYQAIVGQARSPEFYRACGVPDTVDGRFELVALHAFLVLHRLKRDHDRTAGLAQQLFDILFRDMDASLREMGVGDLGVAPRIKVMVQGLYGRIAAYEAGLDAWPDAGPEALMDALRRNLYGTVEASVPDLRVMADYVRREAADLAAQGADALIEGRVAFGAAPGAEEGPS